MKLVKFIGGLGNQMFQYAFLIALQEENQEKVLMDLSAYKYFKEHNGFELTRLFRITAPTAQMEDIRFFFNPEESMYWIKIKKLLCPRFKIENKFYKYYPRYLHVRGNAYYEGYWQCGKYFDKYKSILRREFELQEELDARNQKMCDALLAAKNCVSIHVRRGDYLDYDLYRGLCSMAYYHKAIAHVRTLTNEPLQFVIFSNDLEWCKQHLTPELKGDKVIYADWNKGKESYKDMVLMSHCRYNIIANSSFSWWAAYLNRRSDQVVIAPEKWINLPMQYHVQMPDWTLIEE